MPLIDQAIVPILGIDSVEKWAGPPKICAPRGVAIQFGQLFCKALIALQALCFAVNYSYAQSDRGTRRSDPAQVRPEIGSLRSKSNSTGSVPEITTAMRQAGVMAPPAIGAVSKNGIYNWSPAYVVTSMVFLLETTGDEKWAAAIVDWAEQALAERDAISTTDNQPYAWTDRSSRVLTPYVWIAFTGHNFAPLMQFSSYVVHHRKLGAQAYRGRSYRDYALAYIREFTRALDVDKAELSTDKRHAYFRFAHSVPVKSSTINGQPLPVNMNAGLFMTILHLARAEAAAGRPGVAARLFELVTKFVTYIKDDVLVHRPCGDRTCTLWRYSAYYSRFEDIGHANLTVKFLVDANDNGFDVNRDDIVNVANTFDNLIDADGTIRGNLLDGTTIAGQRNSIYFVFLLGRYSPSLKAKLERIITGSKNFAYWGTWLKIAETAHFERQTR